ncbi:MAG: SAM-dependent methyltransferase [Bacteroidales bacterium]|nr:SAM-dependent methyltransferase [Bacteroidales bacterium]
MKEEITIEEEKMTASFFYHKLGYSQLPDCSGISSVRPEYHELENIGADKVYFSGDFPAVLFKNVQGFNSEALKEIAEIQRKTWNYRKIIFLFAMADSEIRIYNCHEKPKYLKPEADLNTELEPYEVFKTRKDDCANLAKLVNIFSQVGVDCGLIWTSDSCIREKVNTQRRIDRYLVQSLMKTAKALNKDIKNIDIVHGLLMRSLFILYLEDKGAAKETGFYRQIKPDACSYFDILEDKDAAYKLFDVLYEHFNGNVFPVMEGEWELVTLEHLQTIKKCFIDGDILMDPKLFANWRIFDFSFIQIEVLSEVYESFLGESAKQNEKGQFYTPYPMVELMLNDKLFVKNETNYNVKILDIACGSGIFLVESYKRLIRRWKNANHGKKISFSALKDILVNNIFGIEIDPLAIKVAAFSLYLALVEQLDPKTLWIEEEYRLPYLINNPKDPTLQGNQGRNLWCRDTIGEVDAKEFIIKADLLIGNPPFGTKDISAEIKSYLDERKYAHEKVLAFLDKAVQFVKDDGKIALIFNTKALTNTNEKYQKFRKWLLNKTYVEKIYNLSVFRKAHKDFGGQLFNSATVPVSIVYYQKEKPPNISSTIEYCAPKTYVKSNLVDGFIIDSTDIKFLPRRECQKPDTKIWKIAMWGSLQDFEFIKIFMRKNLGLASDKRFITGKGLCCDKKKQDFKPDEVISPKSINRYYTSDNERRKNTNRYRKDNKIEELFNPPYIAVKEMQHDRQIAVSLIDYNLFCTSGAYIINGRIPLYFKQMLVSFYNSDIIRYFLFLTSASWGIERDRVCLLAELCELPLIYSDAENKIITGSFNSIVAQLKSDFPNLQVITANEKLIQNELYKMLNISEKEQILIEDAIKFNLDLFEQGEYSIGLKATTSDERSTYANMICGELNDFYSESGNKINAVIYNIGQYDPLSLIVLHFCNVSKPVETKDAVELETLLKELNKYSIQEKGKNIYLQKQLRYYDTKYIYLIKPNQKRFWTRSQAIDDAMSLIVEIANMGGKK